MKYPNSICCRFFAGIRMHAVWITILWMVASCSTTRNLPEEEILYTGIKSIEVNEKDTDIVGKDALDEVEAALDYAPNNALFGSSSVRIPFPMGLWIYNGFVNKKGKFNKWIFDTFASKPVYITTVNPDVRVAVARNILREHGYFDGTASYQIILDKKSLKKARISYSLEMNHPYTYDSIQYVRVRHRADTLIRAHMDESLLKKGDNFNVIQLDAERQRIVSLLRNNGFYYYRPEFVVYQADTLLSPGKVWLRIARKPGIPPLSLRPWQIGDISVWLSGYGNEQPTDSVRYKDMTIHYEGKLRVRPPVLYKKFKFKPGDIYSQEQQQRTQSGLSHLNIFRYTEMQYTPKDTTRGNEKLDVRVNAVYDLPLDGELEFNVTTKSNDQTGPGTIFSVTRRNVFRGGETFGVQAKGSYEWQTGSRADGGNSSYTNSYELGLNATLTYPSILFPKYKNREFEYPVSTTFRIYGDELNRSGFFRMLSLGGNTTYDFQPTVTTRHSLTPFRLSYSLLQSSTAQFDSIMDSNRALATSLKNQFIPAVNYTYTYDDSPIASRRNYIWLQGSVTQSGNILSGIYAAAGQKFNEKKTLFGNPFSQFVKATGEFRYNYRIDKNNRLVARIFGGAIYSYGNSTISPYSEQFYIGGANSVRAFVIRSVGPGHYKPDEMNDYAYLDQTGDLKLEANLEYRFRIIGNLYGATFLDHGGIWLIRDDPDRPGGQIKLGHVFEDMALGTGLGLRYDLNFLVVRLDLGVALHIPYDTGKSGYFNVSKFKDSYQWHLAIGYPF